MTDSEREIHPKLDNLKSWRYILMLSDYGLYPLVMEPEGGFNRKTDKEEYEEAFKKLVPDRAVIDIRVS